MRFAKKIKRKQIVTTNKSQKKEEKSRTNAIISEVIAEEKGILLTKKNKSRIRTFGNAYMRITSDYVMFKTFGFGPKRIKQFRKKVREYIWMLDPHDKQHPHPAWLSAVDIRSGLLEECEFEFPYRERQVVPENRFDPKSWRDTKAHDILMQIYDDYECVVLWTLHTEWGFGKKRLAQCSLAFRQVDNMPSKLFNIMITELENKLCYKYDTIRDIMSALITNGVHPCDSLPLI